MTQNSTFSDRYQQRLTTRTEWLGRAALLALAMAVAGVLTVQLDLPTLATDAVGWEPYSIRDVSMLCAAGLVGGALASPLALGLYGIYSRLNQRRRNLLLPALWFLLPGILLGLLVVLELASGGDFSTFRWSEFFEFVGAVWLFTLLPMVAIDLVFYAWDRGYTPSWPVVIAVVVAVVLVIAGGPAAAQTLGVAAEDSEHSHTDFGWQYENVGFQSNAGVLACDDPGVDVAPGNATELPSSYEPAATIESTDDLWVSRVRAVPRNGSEEHIHVEPHEYAIELRRGGEQVNTSQIVNTGVYAWNGSDEDSLQSTSLWMNGRSTFQNVERAHIYADIVTEDGRVVRYVAKLCPPSEPQTATDSEGA